MPANSRWDLIRGKGLKQWIWLLFATVYSWWLSIVWAGRFIYWPSFEPSSRWRQLASVISFCWPWYSTTGLKLRCYYNEWNCIWRILLRQFCAEKSFLTKRTSSFVHTCTLRRVSTNNSCDRAAQSLITWEQLQNGRGHKTGINLHTKDPKIVGATVQNLDAPVIWRPGILTPLYLI